MTVQQFKTRFNRHPHPPPNPLDEGDGGGVQGLRSLPAKDGPVPVPPGGFQMPTDPSLFDQPDLRV